MEETIKLLIVSMLMPLIGSGLGVSILRSGSKRLKEGAKPTQMSGGQMIKTGQQILATALAALIVSVAAVLLITHSPLTAKARLLAAVLLITLQYALTMGTALSISRKIRKNRG